MPARQAESATDDGTLDDRARSVCDRIRTVLVLRQRRALFGGRTIKALIVDDDLELLDIMTSSLRRGGYEVISAADGRQALERLDTDRRGHCGARGPGLPKLDGFEVCRQIRHSSDVPIVFLSTRTEDAQVVRGFQLGADDYITKPFSLKQLAVRMDAVLRRCNADQSGRAASEVRAGGLVLSLRTYEVTSKGSPVHLTPLEFRILYLLALNEGQILPYARLVDYAWGYDGGDANLLKTHICHIREKLGLPVDGEGSIRSLSTVGYILAKQPSIVARRLGGALQRTA